jgi:hypothetical protein
MIDNTGHGLYGYGIKKLVQYVARTAWKKQE